ncbi:Undecaprenyl-phosphate mannosyltransferase [Novipirellula galeiformis]|uniref:Undecaprenyl-phosphate mannosyltransferase n=2 Tax=Novipirellula galeiformis TaxID=2528004 RepID=A0A5C6CD24_9BACT|nr:Undecaprenyl-phosphate mannosyltransferase [Novipirellula galeiformis]
MIERLRAALPDADLLIVDDNSPDGTATIALDFADRIAELRVQVREHERGLGGAIRYAMNDAIEHHYDYFLNLDGDLSHDPAQLPRLLDRAIAVPEIDVVVGSRYVAGGAIIGWPWRRRMMSRMVNQFATLCLRLPVKDCSGSMRCYRVDTLKQLNLGDWNSQGYSLLEEVLVLLKRKGAVMDEVPITFTDRQRGHSKLTFREAARSAIKIFSLAFR